jgi:MFS family permease
MAALAIVLLVRGRGGDYSLAGGLAGLYPLGMAVGAPVLSRAVDRWRQPPVLTVAAIGSLAGFAALGAIRPTAQPVLAAIAVLVAGFATPPLEPCLRVLWSDVLADDDAVHAAYSLDAATQELIFTVGPLLVVAAVAVAGPGAGAVLAGLLGLLGTLVFSTSGPCRTWRPVHAARHWAGALRSAAMVRMCLALLFVGATVGIFTVAITAHAESVATRSAAAWLIAANAAGALIAGLAFASVRPPADPVGRLRLITIGFACGYAPLLAAPGLGASIPLALISGFGLSPLLATAFVLVDRVAPAGTTTEAFGWIITAFCVGSAVGSAVGGAIAGGPGFRVAMTVAVGSAVLAAALLSPRR